ncbi:sucrase ferredoxin [Deinococcus maricopensis]|uniref:Sucraseferredoxin family protein n=1 Tax=Deinococcus maricopensis (strain DSM 21211 / LMG 22137 / NRRL B-23946 / LB-34) TaxID=709986 RepID=E8U4A9_DEIML|nr:sucrase ferredoxin [Deinococcus maricopensis]ADV65946.1 Sucraseferredoxin family protein [Deinococcus maricopensis DSM 21211]
MSGSPTPLLLCSAASQDLGEELIGTAPTWHQAFALDLPLRTWDHFRDSATWTARRHDLFARLGEHVRATRTGYGLLLYSSGEDTGHVRHYTRTDDHAAFTRTDYQLSADGTLDLLEAALLHPERLPDLQPHRRPTPTLGTDLHVCTHGTVDAACGKLGYPLLAELQAAHGGARVWRTGHFGGHRFAPTLVELPAGRFWGRVTPDVARAIATQTGDPAALAPHLRGWAGLDAWGQVVDRELFAREGWAWLNRPRQARTLHADATGADVQVTARHPDGHTDTYTARVDVTHTLHVPGGSHKPNLTAAPQYRVQALHHA